jgi:hypothetical protein
MFRHNNNIIRKYRPRPLVWLASSPLPQTNSPSALFPVKHSPQHYPNVLIDPEDETRCSETSEHEHYTPGTNPKTRIIQTSAKAWNLEYRPTSKYIILKSITIKRITLVMFLYVTSAAIVKIETERTGWTSSFPSHRLTSNIKRLKVYKHFTRCNYTLFSFPQWRCVTKSLGCHNTKKKNTPYHEMAHVATGSCYMSGYTHPLFKRKSQYQFIVSY